MDPVLVPAPPRSAYNQNRRVSDLLLSQVKHFQHVEVKRGDLGIDPEIARNIHTEGGAAQYISAVTTALRGKALVPSDTSGKLAVMATPKRSRKPQKDLTLSIAAAADTSTASRSGTAKKTANKAPGAKGSGSSSRGKR